MLMTFIFVTGTLSTQVIIRHMRRPSILHPDMCDKNQSALHPPGGSKQSRPPKYYGTWARAPSAQFTGLRSLSIYIYRTYTSITEYIITLILCNTIYPNMLQVKMLYKSKTQVVVQHLTTKELESNWSERTISATRPSAEQKHSVLHKHTDTTYIETLPK